MSDGQTYRTAVTSIGGDVFLSLPDDQYIQMTPTQARAIATKLFMEAASAAGEVKPSVVVFKWPRSTPQPGISTSPTPSTRTTGKETT